MARVGMSVEELAAGVRDAASVKKVFGDPIERDGVTVIPVAAIGGGGAGGGGGTESEGGSGGGFGLGAKPVGVYVVRGGDVTWQPAVDVNKIIAAVQFVLVLGLIAWRSVARRRAKSRR